MVKFSKASELEVFRSKLQVAHDPNKPRICVCGGTGCNAQGSIELVTALHAAVKKCGLDKTVEVKVTGCHGFCEKGPVVVVRPENTFYVMVKAEDAQELVETTLVKKGAVDRLLYVDPGSGKKILREQDVPFYKQQTRIILSENGHLDPTSIDDYILRGGYAALAKALSGMTPDGVIEEIKKSGLRGRGGAGFSTGRKWELCRKTPGTDKYVICNADEGDPGAYMNRSELEGNPHLVLEGMIIGAYAMGAKHAIIYCRAEYPLAIKQLTMGMAQAREYGLLGENILDSGFSLEMKIKQGAGAFVCGEETALMQSIEGKRGMPRPRPPFPAQAGVFGKPSNINNVETWANIPLILNKGSDWFNGIGSEKSKGTKVFSLVGCVNNTGLVEVPFGTSLRTIVESIGGGVPNKRKFKAAQMGGPSGGCIPASQMDVKIDYESLQSLGAIVGSGGLVVMDDTTCMVDLAKFFMEFIQNESCGKCIPCREGTRRMLEILQAITRPRRKEEENDALLRFQGIMHIKELGDVIKKCSLCGLGQTAPNPVLSTMRWFREEYEAHIFERRCPSGGCRELVGAPCQTGCPVGTEVWRYVAHIGRGELEDAYRAIRMANPFPSACARVCNHPCESVCRSGTTGGEAIAIRTLKRYVVENVGPSAYKPSVKPARADAPRVAVIGSGPSGLTVAHNLSVHGYKVTVFEKESKPGGMLMCAIPEYRLPKATLMKEIGSLLNENTELRLNKALGRDFTIDGLLKEGYKAVYVALGAHKSRKLGVPGEDVEGVIHGISFLKAQNLDGKELAAGHVGIIGGGNSALDAARVAIRQKKVKSVTIFYRRSRAEMPAHDEEIVAALAEGVILKEMVAPTKVLSKDGRLAGVEFIRNELSDRDASGRQKPVPVPGSEFTTELDTLIVGISEDPEAGALAGLTVSKGGRLVVNEESCYAGKQGVFGGGDVVTGPSTVVGAIAAGKDAAVMIDRYLTGRQMKKIPKLRLPTVYIEPVHVDEEEGEPSSRVEQAHIGVKEREKNFREVDICVSGNSAMCEARRCLRCDIEFTKPA
ncbi:MAG: NADH-ubiquinone oxidoreductase-F iron-sulfur binding region domain-containing protein [Myxococcota bacterium]|jgi:NADH-quinone oxidoreductase subunit F